MGLTGEAKRQYQREYMAKKRSNTDFRKEENTKAKLRTRSRTRSQGLTCEICGYGLTVDIHHEGKLREEHILCPNHHALVTRGLTTLEGLRDSTQDVRPDPTEAINAVLERKGLPGVRKGVEPMLPFDKKLQASSKRM